MGAIDNLDLRDVAKARASGGSVGSAGVTTVGGYLTTDERLPDLIGSKRFETFAALLADITIIAASVRLFLNLISKSEWQVRPAEVEDARKPQALAVAELVESMMRDHKTPWTTIVRKMAMYRFLGFAIGEWTQKKRADGAIGMDDVAHRPQRTINRWDVDESGTILGVWQYDTKMKEIYLPRDRLVYAVDNALTDSPEGMGLLRNVVRAALRLKGYETLEEIGYETDLRGIPIAYGPWDDINDKVKQGLLTDADRRRYRKPMIDFVTGHLRTRRTGLMLPSETYRSMDDAKTPSNVRKWAAELLQGDGAAFDSMGKAISRIETQIARVLGTEHLLLGEDGAGSLALSKTKAGTFYLNVSGAQYDLAEVFERDWLGPLGDANGWEDDLMPTLEVEEVRDLDISEVTKALADLATAGAPLAPDDPAVVEVREMMGLSPPAEDILARMLEQDQAQQDALNNPPDPAQQSSAVDPKFPDQPKGVAKRWIRTQKGRARHG